MAERQAVKMVLCNTDGDDMGSYNTVYYKNNPVDNIYINTKHNNKSHGKTVASLFVDYSSTGAPTGQTPAQAPQEMHLSTSITYLSAPAEIALTGHSASQAPQEMQSDLILYAIINTSMFLLILVYNIGLLIF